MEHLTEKLNVSQALVNFCKDDKKLCWGCIRHYCRTLLGIKEQAISYHLYLGLFLRRLKKMVAKNYICWMSFIVRESAQDAEATSIQQKYDNGCLKSCIK